MSEEIVNKIAQSGLITIDLEKILPSSEERSLLDLQPFLFKGMIVREKDFRQALKDFDWEEYKDKYVGIYCSSDALIPQWAYMLVAAHLHKVAQMIVLGDEETRDIQIAEKVIADMNFNDYKDQRVIIKGCGEGPVPAAAYLSISKHLFPVAKTIMYGEPCSTVPVYKKPKK